MRMRWSSARRRSCGDLYSTMLLAAHFSRSIGGTASSRGPIWPLTACRPPAAARMDVIFCTATEFFGGKFRLRPIDKIVQEVDLLPGKFVVFVHDNITGHPNYAKELFKALAPLGKKWGCQTTLNMADDTELLALAAESGCLSMFVGLETINENRLKSANKYFNKVDIYHEQFPKFHDYGIMMNTGIIVGFDGDHEGVFEKTLDFLERIYPTNLSSVP
jgi:radical SAM superfamily enzyme YgiQ (UPF0313 family)